MTMVFGFGVCFFFGGGGLGLGLNGFFIMLRKPAFVEGAS